MMSWRHRPLLALLWLLWLLGRATESRAAYTGPPTLRRTKAGLGAGVRRRRGDGRCCCGVGGAVLLCLTTTITRQTQTLQYLQYLLKSVVCPPSPLARQTQTLQYTVCPASLNIKHCRYKHGCCLSAVTIAQTWLP